MSMAAAMIPFAGCQKNELEGGNDSNAGSSTFEIVADIIQTKTTLDGKSVEWEEGDVIYMVTSGNEDGWGKAYVSSDVNNISTIAEFVYADGKFSTSAELANGEYTFNAIYARSNQKTWHRAAGSSHALLTTQTQDCSNPTAHIKQNDALVGTFTASVPMSATAKVAMAHIYTMMQVDIKNETGAELEVKKFEMTVPGAALAGNFNIDDFAAADVSIKTSASETVTVNVTGGTVADGQSLSVYFVTAPFTSSADEGKGITFKVTAADGTTYTKTVNKAITFNAGEYNTTPYTITAADVVEGVSYGLVQEDGAFENGAEYVFAFKDGQDGSYVFIKGNGASNNAKKDALSVNNGLIVNPGDDYVFKAVASGNGFNLQNARNKYICYSSGTSLNTNQDEGSVWIPVFLSESNTYALHYSTSDGRYVAYNGSTDAKAYAYSNFKDQVALGLSLAQYAGAISVFKKDYVPVVVPKIFVGELEFTPLADAESIEIPYRTENVSGTITATVVSDADGMVKGNLTVNADRVIVNLNANTSSSEKVATVKLSYAGAEDVVITITQYRAGAVDAGISSLYASIESTNSNEPDSFVISLENAIVTYVSGSNAFMQDATGGVAIFKSSNGLKAGDKLNGILQGHAYIRNGALQISDFDLTGITKSEGAPVPVTTLTIEELLEDYDSYLGMRIKIEDAEVSDAVNGTSDRYGAVAQDEVTINLYNNNSAVSFVKDDIVDFIAYPSYYNTTEQLLTFESPESKKVATPVISFANNQVTITCATADATIYYRVNGNSDQVYDAPFSITQDSTIEAYATKAGIADSGVASEFFEHLAEGKVEYTLLFGEGYNHVGVSNYMSTWTATNNGFTGTMENWSNNRNGWNSIKCGREKDKSVATITVGPITEAITTVTMTVSKLLDASKVNKLSLSVASDKGFNDSYVIEMNISEGDIVFNIPESEVIENGYYKITVDNLIHGSKNGNVEVSKVVFAN